MAPRRKAPPKKKKKPPVKAQASDHSSSRSNSSTGSRSSSSRSGSEGSDGGSSGSSESSDEDRASEYKRGGYHPVSAFQLYNARYRVLSKLGAGAFSTVWLAADEKTIDEECFNVAALKVCKSKKSVTEQAEDEVALFEKLQEPARDDKEKQGARHVVQMCGHFWQTGPHGRHKCLVFEVMGENLLTLVKNNKYEGLSIPMVRRIARHTLLGLEYIHSRGIAHTDIKLENVLLCRHDLNAMLVEGRGTYQAFDKLRKETQKDSAGLSASQKKRAKKKQKDVVAAAATAAARDEPNDSDEGGAAARASAAPMKAPSRQKESFGSLSLDRMYCKLGDFGNGCHLHKKITDDIQTRQYRSPEILIGCDWDATADVWSAACMFFELLTGDFLFDPRTGSGWDRDEDHIALIVELLGCHPPKEWVLAGKYARDFFTTAGKLKHIKNLKMWCLRDVLKEKYKKTDAEAREIADLLLPMLAWEPKERWSASRALEHRWLSALPHEVGEVFVPCTAAESAAPVDGAAVPATKAAAQTPVESPAAPVDAVAPAPEIDQAGASKEEVSLAEAQVGASQEVVSLEGNEAEGSCTEDAARRLADAPKDDVAGTSKSAVAVAGTGGYPGVSNSDVPEDAPIAVPGEGGGDKDQQERSADDTHANQENVHANAPEEGKKKKKNKNKKK